MKRIVRPSHLLGLDACCSVLNKREAETVAMYIISILYITGDEFRLISRDEYMEKRGENEWSDNWFEDVIPYFKDAATAASFCPEWGNMYYVNKNIQSL